MRKRLISAFIMLLIGIPIFLMGGNLYNLMIILIAMLGLKEFIDIKETRKKLPLFVKVLSYIFLVLFLILNIGKDIYLFMIDFRIISCLFITFLLPTILYHDREKYSITDSFYMIGGLFFIGASFILLISMRTYNMNLLIYLLLITIFTDTFAYIIGRLVGKTKLLEEISPNKTLEGTIGGTLVGTYIASLYYHVVISPDKLLQVIIITIFLSILGQFGDLFFSAIKRYYGKKDFSNLIPGHGGILDRVDSILFVLLGFMLFITIL